MRYEVFNHHDPAVIYAVVICTIYSVVIAGFVVLFQSDREWGRDSDSGGGWSGKDPDCEWGAGSHRLLAPTIDILVATLISVDRFFSVLRFCRRTLYFSFVYVANHRRCGVSYIREP